MWSTGTTGWRTRCANVSVLWTDEPPLKCCIHRGFRRILKGSTGICWISGWPGASRLLLGGTLIPSLDRLGFLSLSRGSVRPIPTRTQPAASPRWLSNRAYPSRPISSEPSIQPWASPHVPRPSLAGSSRSGHAPRCRRVRPRPPRVTTRARSPHRRLRTDSRSN